MMDETPDHVSTPTDWFRKQIERQFKEEVQKIQQLAEKDFAVTVELLIDHTQAKTDFFQERHRMMLNKNRRRIVEWMNNILNGSYSVSNDHVYDQEETEEESPSIDYPDDGCSNSCSENSSNDFHSQSSQGTEDSITSLTHRKQTIQDYLGIILVESETLEEKHIDISAICKFLNTHVEGGYGWLIHEDVEGLFCTLEDFEQAIKDDKSIVLDGNIIELLFCAMSFELDWEEHDICDELYIQNTYVSALERLQETEFSDLKERAVSHLKDVFTFHRQDFDSPFNDIPDQFNKFVSQKNWLDAMITWSYYTTYRKYCNTIEIPSPTMTDDTLSSQTMHTFNQEQSLKTRLVDAYDRAKKAYTKVYPHPNTTQVVYGKHIGRAQMNFADKLTILKTIGLQYEAQRPSRAKAANIFVPQFYFIVSEGSRDPTVEMNPNDRLQFMHVPFVLTQGDTRAVHRNRTDVVFKGNRKGDAFYYQTAKDHIVKGCKIQGKSDENTTTFVQNVITEENGIFSVKKGQTQRLLHSERVLIEALSDGDNIQDMVNKFQEQLQKTGGPGLYHVYGALMLGYSTNTICEYCTPSLISLQNSTEQGGFLNQLVLKLLSAEGPVTFGVYGAKNDTRDWSKFHLNTIISGQINFDSEAHDLAEKGQHSHGSVSQPPKHTHNPKAKLFFEDDEIDIQPCSGSTKTPYFFEFVGTSIHTPFMGTVFASGTTNIPYSRSS